MGRKKKNTKLGYKRILVGLIILLPLVLIIGISIPTATTFNVSVTTELLAFKTLDSDHSKLSLRDVQVYNYNGDSLGRFSGSFKISPNAETHIERIAHGPLSIQITGGSNNSAGDFYAANSDLKMHAADHFVEFYVEDMSSRLLEGETIIIPINGEVSLGRNVNYETYSNSNALLRHGNVVVIGKSLLSNSYYKSSTYDLNIGDEFRVVDPISKAYGFATINENVGMTVAYKVIGKEGRILTPGPRNKNSGYPVSLSFLSKINNDTLFKGLSLFTAFLISLATLIPFFTKYQKE